MQSIRLNTLQSWGAHIPRWVLILIAGLTPAIVTLLLMNFHLRVDVHDFLPSPWNDQTWNWHQVLTFSQAGLNGGYYTVNEEPAPVSAFHFSAWGPFFPMLYGSIARLTGWQPYTGIFVNMAVLAVAVWLFLILARFDRWQIILVALVLCAVGPVINFIPTISQENFNQAIAFALGLVFFRLIGQKPITFRFYLGGLALLVVASLFRFSWALLLLPFFVLAEPRLSLRSIIKAVILAGLVSTIIFEVVGKISAPGGSVVTELISEIAASPINGVTNLWSHIVANLNEFLPVPEAGKLGAIMTEILQVGMLLVICAVGSLPRNQIQPIGMNQFSPKEMRFHLYNLGSVVVMGLVFYASYGFYRIFAPHLLLTLLLLIAFRRYYLVGICLFISAVMLGTFMTDYHNERLPNYTLDQQAAQVETTRQQFADILVYHADTQNAWCNTLLIPVTLLDYRTTLVPAGIGISFYEQPDQLTVPIRSAYVLLDETSEAQLGDRWHLTPLTATALGTLYWNNDSVCK